MNGNLINSDGDYVIIWIKRFCGEEKKFCRRYLILWIILIIGSCLIEVKKKCEGCFDLLFFVNFIILLIFLVVSYIIYLFVD